MLYKDPITDDGTKKSQKGRVIVLRDENGDLTYIDNLYKSEWEKRVNNGEDELRTVFKDGKVMNTQSFDMVRATLKHELSGSTRRLTTA